MSETELGRRIEELDTGKHDPESLRQIALKLHKEGYPPTLITQMLKRKFGRGVPLTIFSKQPVGVKSFKSKISALKTVRAKIQQQIVVEANEKVTRCLRTGKLIEDRLAPIANQHGYEDTGQFIVEKVYPFFDLNYNHVEKLEVENLDLRSGMQRLMELLGPEAKRRLFLKEASDFIKATALMGQLTPHPMPPNILQDYIKILWENFYEDTAATLKDTAFWTKKFVKKATGN